MSQLVLRNRGHGPIGILDLVDERSGGDFEHIDNIIPRAEVEDFMSHCKAVAGFARDALNAELPTIDTAAIVG